jgi:hypothetical protein
LGALSGESHDLSSMKPSTGFAIVVDIPLAIANSKDFSNQALNIRSCVPAYESSIMAAGCL